MRETWIARRVRCTRARRQLEDADPDANVALQRLLFRTECALDERVYA